MIIFCITKKQGTKTFNFGMSTMSKMYLKLLGPHNSCKYSSWLLYPIIIIIILPLDITTLKLFAHQDHKSFL